MDARLKKRAWFDANRPALEAIIQQQQEPQAMTGEPRGSMSDLAIRFQEIENRLNKLEQSERIHESNQNVILETVKALSGAECPCDQTSDDFCDLMKRVEALEARQPQTPAPKPKCERCGDTKLLNTTLLKANGQNVAMIPHTPKLCPCVKVGDVVNYDVIRVLPDGSDHTAVGFSGSMYKILRIGPAPATDDDKLPLSTLLADPRLRPLVEVVKAAQHFRVDSSSYWETPLIHAVDALSPELRAAIDLIEKGN